MPTSQYKQYGSSDAGGPGLLTGQAGTLGVMLKTCLVDGYTGHAAAGWSNPVAAASNIYSFAPVAGSTGCGFVLNDNGPNVTSTYKEAWITGWETIAGVGAPVGSGSGQYPLPAQQLTTGHGVIRKSASADAVGRTWLLYADGYSFLLFIADGDNAGWYSAYHFGDLHRLNASTDTKGSLLIAKDTENVAADTGNYFAVQTIIPSLCNGHWTARGWGGTGGSVQMGKQGFIGAAVISITPYYYLDGLIPAPNGPDNSLLVYPISVFDSAGHVRGHIRGLYHICHARATFSDGQPFSGGGDLAGKSFVILKNVYGYNNNAGPYGGFVAVETSATLATN